MATLYFASSAGTLVATALYTGLRRNNITGLCWRQVDLDENKITIPASEMKAGESHEVPIHPQLEALLREGEASGDAGPLDFEEIRREARKRAGLASEDV